MEMPEGTDPIMGYDNLVYAIQERLQMGQTPVKVTDHIYKLEGNTDMYYWWGSPNRVDLAVEIEKTPQSLVVGLLGKNPLLKGQSPYASDLYVAIVNDSELSLLLSDQKVSAEGLKVWKTLVELGYSITVYDSQTPGQSRKTIQDPDQLDQYFGHKQPEFTRYRYVLSKPGMQLWETVAFFNTRRYREFAGMENP